MKRSARWSIIFFSNLFCITAFAQQWQPVPGHIATRWATQVDSLHPLQEYPRPQLQRKEWTNLNGLWNYAIVPVQDEMPPSAQGRILVPYAVESSLSGVGKTVGDERVLWYQRKINIKKIKGRKWLLHFGAVDWRATVFINGKQALEHEGGYDPFTIDITALLQSAQQEIKIKVWDPSDDGPQPRGKQQKNPRGIWYTPVTGIWQTVWLEQVADTYIETTRQTPDFDHGTLTVKAAVQEYQPGDIITASVWDAGKKITEAVIDTTVHTLSIPDAKSWSPAHPFLYDLKYTVTRKGKLIDEATSYFAMRKIGAERDEQGILRMTLNNEFQFQFGPLDQGWWPDGLYTAPTDAALAYDIQQMKDMGFNMIRKHVKVEPARWYYHCDQLGMLVWQDMPSGDMGNKWESRPGVYGRATDRTRTSESEHIYRTEWKSIIDALYNFPCIVVWVPFNEAWGQFKTKEIADWTLQRDPSRLVNAASGGNFDDAGQIVDLHNYPEPLMPHPDLFGKNKILVLGEFGGLGMPIENHTWQDKNNWGYQSFKTRDSLQRRYTELVNSIPRLIEKGLSAAVYTQTTDVEGEVNGLMTYDRAEIKMDLPRIAELHKQLFNPALVHLKK